MNLMEQSKFEDRILELCDNWEEITRSDLQGAVSAIVMSIYNKGKEDGKKEN